MSLISRMIASGAGCLAMAVVGLVHGFVAVMATVIIAAIAYAPLLVEADRRSVA